MQKEDTEFNNLAEEEMNFKELQRRGISQEVIDLFNIHYIPDGLPFAFKSGLAIPINHPDGTFSFNKYRRSYLNNEIKQKYAYDRGSHTALFAGDRIKDSTSVVVTEGEMDALVLWSRNIDAVSSTGGAQSFQSDFGELLAGKRIYLCYDNDEAGAVGLVKTLEVLPEAYIVFVPEVIGVKDISDFVARGGDFHALMQTARQYLSVGEVEEDMVKRASQWLPTRFHTAYLAAHAPQPVKHVSGVTYDGDDRLLRAKAVPCTEVYTFGRNRKGVCLWHSDTDPSLHYYPAKNTCYCHSCGKYADVVDIVMAKQNMSMKEAISFLLGE